MGKVLIVLILILFALGGTGVFFYLTLTIDPTTIVNQFNSDVSLESLAGYNRLSEAAFRKVDQWHDASGQAAVYTKGDQKILRLEGFSVTNGPDLFVYLSKEKNLSGLRPKLGEFISLGKLKSITGEQTYLLPDNYQEYSSVVIWCRAFGIHFSSAEFKEFISQ